jgi:hypothetical protein
MRVPVLVRVASIEQSDEAADRAFLEPQAQTEFLLGQWLITDEFGEGVRLGDADGLAAGGPVGLVQSERPDEGHHPVLQLEGGFRWRIAFEHGCIIQPNGSMVQLS